MIDKGSIILEKLSFIQGLARYLTPEEIELEKRHFHDYDKNNDGWIDSREARYCIAHRYSHLVDRGMLTDEQLHKLVDTKMSELVASDRDGDGKITWEEYIEAQAL